MKISVIVPAFNEERGLAGSLQSIRRALAALDERGWASELIVCDNNSTDRTAAIARQHGAEVVFEPVNQISRARNVGAARATGEWLVFVDADSHPSRELFADMAHVIGEGRCLAGGSTVRVDATGITSKLVIGGWNAISRMMSWAAGSFIFCEASAFREIGGFSLEFYAAEEIDVSRRLKRLAGRRGLRFVILHRHPLQTSGRKKYLYSRREHLAFMLKMIVRGARTLRSREACYPWYDGRR
jgi:glycosyltransferase involved in cell wall biosynthesis